MPRTPGALTLPATSLLLLLLLMVHSPSWGSSSKGLCQQLWKVACCVSRECCCMQRLQLPQHSARRCCDGLCTSTAAVACGQDVQLQQQLGM